MIVLILLLQILKICLLNQEKIQNFHPEQSALIHVEALRLFTDLGIESQLGFEVRHKAIIEQFGRYPHRNAILNRTSTAAEVAFLQQPGSSF